MPEHSPQQLDNLECEPMSLHLESCGLNAVDTNSEGIELTVQNLSVSIISEPSLFMTGLRTIKKGIQSAAHCISRKRFPPSEQQQALQNNRDLSGIGISVLRNVSMHVEPGQVCLILGASGAGKSTLLNIMAGRMKWSQVAMVGDINFHGDNAASFWKSNQVGFLYQDDHLEPYLSPRETLQFVAKLYEGYSRMTPEMSTRVETLIAKLGLKDCADRIIGVPDGNHTCGKANNGAGGSSTQGSSSSTQRTQQSISGGERRRVSVAMQLLTNPSVLFCDEPTSGLDAFASFELWKTLTHLAKSEHKTVVVSAHQPRSEVFQLLAENQGQLVMLSLGQVVYSGPIDEALDWFARQPDVPSCLKNINPFDYLMDLCGVNHTSEQQEEESRQRHKSLVKAWNEAVPSKIPDCVESTQPTLSSSSSCSRQPAPSAWKTMKNIGSHTIILAHRGLMSQARNKTWVVAFVLCYGLIGLWTGAIFHRLSISILGIRARHLAVMLFVNMCPMSCMAAMLYRLCHDVRTFDRERKDRWYGPLAFVLASVLKNMPLAFLGTTAYTTFVYLLVDLRRDLEHLSASIGALFFLQLAMCAFPIPFSAMFRGFVPASCIFFCFASLFILTSGTHVPYDKIPDALVWTKYINYMADTFKVLLSAEFSDREFDCPFDIGVGVRDPVRCQWYDGNEYLRMNGNIQPHYYPGPVFIILVHAIALTLISWLLFAFKEVEPSAAVEPNNFLAALIYLVKAPFASNDLSKSTLESSDGPKKSLQSIRGTQQQSLDKKEEADIEDEKYEETRIHMYGKTLAQCDPVEIRVDKVSLSSSVKATQDEVKYRGLLPRCIASCFQPAIRSQRHILKEIDLRFVPGELTAILGASGAGKTSLANTILHRSPAHLQRQGDIWFNGSKNPTLRQINAVCGHVRQDDSFLHSHLTVRETLRYAAELSVNCKDRRSDTCEGQPSLAEAWNKAEVIMELMGLYECADVFVGGPGVTGCSGGQRRRLSIALQLLLEPACLILDEPTTGLDATSALSLIQTLKTIARTGRTIICTIHQPRAAIWDEFDQVVLLLPGGRVGYAGRRESILDFFASAGMERPESVNIPDFIIDTASINYASETTESETRQHITRLAAEFQKYRVQNVTRLSSQLKGHHESSSADTADSTSINVQELSEEKTPHYTPIMRAVPILSRRMFTNEVRQTSLFLNRACLGFMVGLVPSAMAVHMDWTLSGLMMRTFFINQLVFVSLTGVFAVVSLFPKQKQVAFHEVSKGHYSISAFLCSYIINALPHELIVAAAVTFTNMWLVPFEKSFKSIAIFYAVIFAYYSAGESLALLVSTWTTNECITLTATVSFILLYSFTTPLINSAIPPAMRILGSSSVWSLGMKALAITQIAGGVVQDDTSETGPSSLIRTGEDMLAYVRMNNLDLGYCLAAMVATVVGYRLLVWVSLIVKVKREKW